MGEIRILGIRVNDRIKEADRTQHLISKYASLVNVRLGFHELNTDVCSRTGFIILQLKGSPEGWKIFQDELNEIGGIEVQNMNFQLD
jgi:hypothetical protein